MSLFGYSIIKTEDLDRYKHREFIVQRIYILQRWFSGWKDLDIIFDYVFNPKGEDISSFRRRYAKARNTDEYGRGG